MKVYCAGAGTGGAVPHRQTRTERQTGR